MSDLIRREDAFSKFEKACTCDSVDKNGMKRGEIKTALTWEGIRKILENIPSAEPEQRWIPATEALPEEEKEVLVSMHFDGYKDEYINYPPSDYVEIASHIDGVWSSICDDFRTMRRLHHVVAWMEEPKPYRGE